MNRWSVPSARLHNILGQAESRGYPTYVIWYRRINHSLKSRFRWFFAVNSNHVIAFATIVTALATISYAIYARGQWMAMNNTLGHMRTSGSETSSQTSDLIHEAQIMSDALEVSNDQNRQSMEQSLAQGRTALDATIAQNKKSLEETLSQGQKALDASIEASRLDRRPWLGLAFFKVTQFGVDKSL